MTKSASLGHPRLLYGCPWLTRFQASIRVVLVPSTKSGSAKKKLPENMATRMSERKRNSSAGSNHGLIWDPSNARRFESNFNSLSTRSACDSSRSRSWTQKMDDTKQGKSNGKPSVQTKYLWGGWNLKSVLTPHAFFWMSVNPYL